MTPRPSQGIQDRLLLNAGIESHTLTPKPSAHQLCPSAFQEALGRLSVNPRARPTAVATRLRGHHLLLCESFADIRRVRHDTSRKIANGQERRLHALAHFNPLPVAAISREIAKISAALDALALGAPLHVSKGWLRESDGHDPKEESGRPNQS